MNKRKEQINVESKDGLTSVVTYDFDLTVHGQWKKSFENWKKVEEVEREVEKEVKREVVFCRSSR